MRGLHTCRVVAVVPTDVVAVLVLVVAVMQTVNR
jgi:hypothetical protein